MVRHIKLKIKDHNEDDAYEVYPMNISKDVFVSFIMYDDEGLFPHCHIKIWRKVGEKREELYPKIIEECIAYGIGVIDAKTIDEVNI